MQVSGIQRDVTLNSAGGDVTISGLESTANVSTGGGNVSASDLGSTVQFSTDGGDVDGNGLFAPHVTTHSGGGNVTLVFTRAPAYLTSSVTGETSTSCSRRAAPATPLTTSPTAATTAHRWDSGQQVRPPDHVESGGGNIEYRGRARR